MTPYAEVIGDPVAHSKSPLIHKYWLDRVGFTGDYRRTRVEPDSLARYFNERRSDPAWRGCNVTVPHKQSVLAFLNEIDPTAAAVGAANCIVCDSTALTGYNTDVDGIAAALRDVELAHAKIAIIGGGGAARASMAYLGQRKAAKVTLLVRDPAKAAQLQSFETIEIASIDQADTVLAAASLVINASPLGMTGCPAMPSDLLAAVARSNATLFDMVYDPLVTPFLSAGRGQTIGGLTMLVGQAAKAFELFFGVSAPTPNEGLLKLLTSTA